jgi:hypothetical protein
MKGNSGIFQNISEWDAVYSPPLGVGELIGGLVPGVLKKSNGSEIKKHLTTKYLKGCHKGNTKEYNKPGVWVAPHLGGWGVGLRVGGLV